jgi:hypothetical protein
METLSFLDEDKSLVINLFIAKSNKIKPTEGFFNVAEGQILLGSDRFEEWQSIYGNTYKQKAFIKSLSVVYRTLI